MKINSFILTSNLLILFLSSGCFIPESNHIVPSYHLLTPLDFESNVSKFSHGISFHIREVNIPPYLEENRIVSRVNNSTINYRENDRWAEPLSEGISRVASKNLAHVFDTLNFSAFPHRPKNFCLYEISFEVQRFEKTTNDQAFIDVIIGIYNKNQLIEKLRYKKAENINNSSVHSEINALSKCLQKVCKQLAQDIESLPLTNMISIIVEEIKFVNEPVLSVIERLCEIYSENISGSPELEVLLTGNVQTEKKEINSVYRNQNLLQIYQDISRISGLKMIFEGQILRLSKIY